MGQTGRMQRDRPDLNAATGAEVARDVIDHLLRLQIRVVIRNRDREWIEVKFPRAERADDEVAALEGLMRRRRLMDPARDRLEIVDRERPGKEETVPPHDVEGMVVEHVGLIAVAHPHLYRELAFLSVCVQLRGRMDVAVVIRL